jgi:hypothetical protein
VVISRVIWSLRGGTTVSFSARHQLVTNYYYYAVHYYKGVGCCITRHCELHPPPSLETGEFVRERNWNRPNRETIRPFPEFQVMETVYVSCRHVAAIYGHYDCIWCYQIDPPTPLNLIDSRGAAPRPFLRRGISTATPLRYFRWLRSIPGESSDGN